MNWMKMNQIAVTRHVCAAVTEADYTMGTYRHVTGQEMCLITVTYVNCRDDPLPAAQLTGRAVMLPVARRSGALTFQHNGANNAFICSPFMDQQSELMP